MKNKKITVAALIVAVLSLSIGFAAFSNSLNIKSSANVNPSDKDFKIVFSKERDTFVSGNEIINATGDINENTKKGSINATGDTLYNLETEFTTPGESVEYSLYIKNIGAYNAVLNKLEIEEAELTSDITVDNYYIVDNGSVKCYAKKDPQNKANEQLLKEACNNIKLKVKLQQESVYITSTKEFDSYVINKGESESVTVTLEYTGDTVADTGFNVVFGSVKMNYATTKVSSSTPVDDQVCFYTSLNADNTVSINAYNNSCSKDVVIPSNLPLTSIESLDTEACINKLVATGDFDSTEAAEVCKIDSESLPIALGRYNLSDAVKVSKSSDNYPVSNIGTGAFMGKSLLSVIIPNGIKAIDQFAFYQNNLTSVIIPDSVTSIGDDAFESNKLSSIKISNNLTSIGVGIFAYNKLTSVTIPDNITSIGNYAFNWNNITSVVIGSGITSIGNEAFGNNSYDIYGPNKIESVTINTTKDKVTVNAYAFNWVEGKSDADIKWAE